MVIVGICLHIQLLTGRDPGPAEPDLVSDGNESLVTALGPQLGEDLEVALFCINLRFAWFMARHRLR